MKCRQCENVASSSFQFPMNKELAWRGKVSRRVLGL